MSCRFFVGQHPILLLSKIRGENAPFVNGTEAAFGGCLVPRNTSATRIDNADAAQLPILWDLVDYPLDFQGF